MKHRSLPGLVLVVLVALTGCKKPSSNLIVGVATNYSEPTQAQPRLPTIRLWIGPEQMTAEMAVTPREVTTGMMFRTNMDENEGMVFVLPYTQQASFWMKNCYIPLSVAYIDPDGVIQEIHHLEPQNTNSVISAHNDIRFALETRQGWFKRHHIHAGMSVHTERGSLMETFDTRQ